MKVGPLLCIQIITRVSSLETFCPFRLFFGLACKLRTQPLDYGLPKVTYFDCVASLCLHQACVLYVIYGWPNLTDFLVFETFFLCFCCSFLLAVPDILVTFKRFPSLFFCFVVLCCSTVTLKIDTLMKTIVSVVPQKLGGQVQLYIFLHDDLVIHKCALRGG